MMILPVSEQRAQLRRKMTKLENMLLLKRQREKQYQNLLEAIGKVEEDICRLRSEVRLQERQAFEEALGQFA